MDFGFNKIFPSHYLGRAGSFAVYNCKGTGTDTRLQQSAALDTGTEALTEPLRHWNSYLPKIVSVFNFH